MRLTVGTSGVKFMEKWRLCYVYVWNRYFKGTVNRPGLILNFDKKQIVVNIIWAASSWNKRAPRKFCTYI